MKTAIRAGALSLVLIGAAVAATSDRFPQLSLDTMTPAQRKVADAILTGPRKDLAGP